MFGTEEHGLPPVKARGKKKKLKEHWKKNQLEGL